MREYLVIWEQDGEVTYSEVTLGDAIDVQQVSEDEWVTWAMESENTWTEEEIKDLVADGYRLILVCSWPDEIIY